MGPGGGALGYTGPPGIQARPKGPPWEFKKVKISVEKKLFQMTQNVFRATFFDVLHALTMSMTTKTG